MQQAWKRRGQAAQIRVRPGSSYRPHRHRAVSKSRVRQYSATTRRRRNKIHLAKSTSSAHVTGENMWLEKNFAAFALLVILSPSAMAWGGLFNRFSPEMLSNLGYGGHGGFGGYRAQPFLQRYETPEILQELDEAEEPDEPCYGKKCTSNEYCCPGSVCVYADGLMGTCLFMYGLKQGEICHRSNDCEKGLLCQDAGDTRTCQPPLDNKKQYSENCLTSSECDISKGLCCQLQRRHRQAPRKVCSYFKDPLVCSGPVATDQIISQIEHTAGEKRLTGKMNHFNHIRK